MPICTRRKPHVRHSSAPLPSPLSSRLRPLLTRSRARRETRSQPCRVPLLPRRCCLSSTRVCGHPSGCARFPRCSHSASTRRRLTSGAQALRSSGTRHSTRPMPAVRLPRQSSRLQQTTALRPHSGGSAASRAPHSSVLDQVVCKAMQRVFVCIETHFLLLFVGVCLVFVSEHSAADATAQGGGAVFARSDPRDRCHREGEPPEGLRLAPHHPPRHPQRGPQKGHYLTRQVPLCGVQMLWIPSTDGCLEAAGETRARSTGFVVAHSLHSLHLCRTRDSPTDAVAPVCSMHPTEGAITGVAYLADPQLLAVGKGSGLGAASCPGIALYGLDAPHMFASHGPAVLTPHPPKHVCHLPFFPRLSCVPSLLTSRHNTAAFPARVPRVWPCRSRVFPAVLCAHLRFA